MKITGPDIILGSLATGGCVLAGGAAAWAASAFVSLERGHELFVVFVFLVAFLVSTLLLLRAIAVVIPLREGTFDLGTDTHSLVWKLLGHVYTTHLWPLFNASLVPVNLRGLAYSLVGARVPLGVMVGGKILEPTLVEVGSGSQLGEDSLLTAHAVEGGRVDLGKIVIGRGVTIGAKALVLPGVSIGDGAMVAAGAVVAKGTQIGAGEIWAGVPARLLKRREDLAAGEKR